MKFSFILVMFFVASISFGKTFTENQVRKFCVEVAGHSGGEAIENYEMAIYYYKHKRYVTACQEVEKSIKILGNETNFSPRAQIYYIAYRSMMKSALRHKRAGDTLRYLEVKDSAEFFLNGIDDLNAENISHGGDETVLINVEKTKAILDCLDSGNVCDGDPESHMTQP